MVEAMHQVTRWRAAGGGRRAAHTWHKLLTSRGARVQQYFLLFWHYVLPCFAIVKHQDILHLAF